MCRDSAARVKPPVRASAAKARNWRSVTSIGSSYESMNKHCLNDSWKLRLMGHGTKMGTGAPLRRRRPHPDRRHRHARDSRQRAPVLNHAARLIIRGFEILIVACLAIMGILVFGNVVLRYAVNSGIAISEELSRLLFVWLIFMGAVLASARRIHIGFDTLQRAVGPRVRRALVVFTG